LVHGHYDSWYVGIGDNAVGDATLLELARVFYKHRKDLSRSLKIAWWPGHSNGRYAGSTWFADTFGLSLARDCIAQVNIDSPGCRWATEYYDVSWMKEAENFCIRVIQDATGKKASGRRSLQAGDYSFNNIGLTGFFMLFSSIPKELLLEKGYYPVGGCGGNIEWHTEHDTMEIADPDNLMRDLRVYAVALQRVINNPIHPFDFRELVPELNSTLADYAEGAGNEVDFTPAFEALADLKNELVNFYDRVEELAERDVQDPAVRVVNDTMLKLGRLLIPINFTRRGQFRTEPSVPIPPLPDLAPAVEIEGTSGHQRYIIQTHLRRGINRVASSFCEAAQLARNSLG
jgi:N-acetylated-alpha-linked acidic dipeptidase